MRMMRRAGLLGDGKRILTVYRTYWNPGLGVDPMYTNFFVNGDTEGKDIYAYVAGHTSSNQGGSNRMQYKVRVEGLRRGDVITFDWDARNYTTIWLLGTIVISDDIYSIAGTKLKDPQTNGPSSITYTATMDNDGLDLSMRLGTSSDDRCYIWLNNILVNGERPTIVADHSR